MLHRDGDLVQLPFINLYTPFDIHAGHDMHQFEGVAQFEHSSFDDDLF